MGLDFHVQLLIDNPDQPMATVVNLPCLGNASIRDAIAPLMEIDEWGCIPCTGSMPIDVGTTAFLRVVGLHKEIRKEKQELFERLTDSHDPRQYDDPMWEPLRRKYSHFSEYDCLLTDSLSSVKKASQNPAMRARIVWA